MVQEIASMASQLSYLYSTNRTAPRPFATLLHTSWSSTASPRLWGKMTKSNWERWSRCFWWAEGVESVSQALTSPPGSEPVRPTMLPTDESLESHLTGPRLPPILSTNHKLVYLSADASEELATLSEDEVYIIGGIVDRNRHKVGSDPLPLTPSHCQYSLTHRTRCYAKTKRRSSGSVRQDYRSGRTWKDSPREKSSP